jgi:hypothetical protein
MPRSTGVSVENNFSRGLITEATAMNTPENCVVEATNTIFTQSGKTLRRYGVDYEDDYEVHSFTSLGVLAEVTSPTFDDVAINEFEWTTVATTEITFLVVQVGDLISFYEVDEANGISYNKKTFTVELGDFKADPDTSDATYLTLATKRCSFSSGNGYLFVNHQNCDPFYVSYDPDADTITANSITVKVRDFNRLDDGLEIDERPNTLTDAHKYNLYNQGWFSSQTVEVANVTSQQNVLDWWDGFKSDYPSNADIFWAFRNAEDVVEDNLINKVEKGNSASPNGHFIYTAWDVDRDAILGTTGLPSESSGFERPSVNGFFAGRIFYSGVAAEKYSTKVYFSKIIEGEEDFGVCYQSADPTNETNADLLESDGGVISIAEAGRILSLIPLRSALIVIATNGIWKISGSQNSSFRANDYSVSKIGSTSVASDRSVVIAEGTPFWWDISSIYTVQYEPTTGLEQVVSISDQTIKQEILDIPFDNKRFIKGAYNNLDKTIHWIVRSTPASNLLESYQYDKVFVLNVLTGSFSIMDVMEAAPKISGVVHTNKSSLDPYSNNESASTIKYVTTGDIGASDVRGFTISQFKDSDFLDWKTFDGVGLDAGSYFISGYRIRGELLRKFQSNYVVVITEYDPENADDYGCLVQGIWNYNSSESGKATVSQQIYVTNPDKNFGRRKLKIRGNGYSLQFKFRSQPGKAFSILGWVVGETANNVP